MFVNGKEIFKFKADNKNVNFSTQFSLASVSNGFSTHVPKEVFLHGNVYDFSADYNSTDKSYLLNIHKYLQNIHKIILSFIKEVFNVLLSFNSLSARNQIKCLFLNDEPYLVRSTFIDI